MLAHGGRRCSRSLQKTAGKNEAEDVPAFTKVTIARGGDMGPFSAPRRSWLLSETLPQNTKEQGGRKEEKEKEGGKPTSHSHLVASSEISILALGVLPSRYFFYELNKCHDEYWLGKQDFRRQTSRRISQLLKMIMACYLSSSSTL